MIPLVLVGLQATVQYHVTLEGGGQGTARLTQTKRPEGGKVVRLIANLRRGNSAIEVRTESTFDKDGNPLRKVQSYGPAGRAPQHEAIVTFDADGANAVVRERGVPKVSKVPLVPKLNRANAAETWFFSTKPKVGDVAKAWTFDPDNLEWVPTETTYVGPSKGGHLLRVMRRDRKTETVVDDKGLPIRLQDSAMTLERR
ncbi:hypothetical protein EON82_04775 [bacterium]|nr:MAG: hypothetical protein EON82_04775 [bacterium]